MKIFNKLTIVVLLSLFTTTISAQNAKTVLDNAAAKIAGKSMKITFNITNFNQKVKPTNTTSGTLDIDGSQFRLTTSYTTMWFNGKTLWSLINGSDEVNVSNPSKQELQQLNPTSFIYLYKQGGKLTLKNVNYQQEPCYEISIYPKGKANFNKLMIIINKNYTIKNIRIKDNKGLWTRFSIGNIQMDAKFSPSNFTFNPKNYPNIEVNDLR